MLRDPEFYTLWDRLPYATQYAAYKASYAAPHAIPANQRDQLYACATSYTILQDKFSYATRRFTPTHEAIVHEYLIPTIRCSSKYWTLNYGMPDRK